MIEDMDMGIDRPRWQGDIGFAGVAIGCDAITDWAAHGTLLMQSGVVLADLRGCGGV
jgi:hypothetical protein